MPKTSLLKLPTLLLVLAVSPLATTGQESRVWTDSTGNFHTNAILISALDGHVKLEGSDGRIIYVAIERLCEADQEYIRRQLEADPTRTANAEDRIADAKNVTDACKELTDQVIASYNARGPTGSKPRIAIRDFVDDNGSASAVGDRISEELVALLVSRGAFTLHERQRLDDILEKNRQDAQGFVTPDSAKQIGKKYGVDAILTGTICAVGEAEVINARLISTETGQLAAVARATIGPLSPQIHEAGRAVAQKIIDTYRGRDRARVAVVELGGISGKPPVFGRVISEEIVTRLFRTGRFDVMENLLMDVVLSEHRLGSDGFLETTAVKNIGEEFGVQAVITGTSYIDGDAWKVNARLVDTTTGAITAAAGVSLRGPDRDEDKRTTAIDRRPGIAPDIFFSEDFSTVKPGHVPDGWLTEKLLVRELPNGKKGVVNFEQQKVHKLNVGNVDFPEDFSFEWIIATHAHRYGLLSSVSYSMEVGDARVRLHIPHNPYDGAVVSINDTKATVNFNAVSNRIVKLTLVKRGPVFQVLLDDREILLARYETYKHARGFTFTAEARESEYQFAILKVSGTVLSP